MLEKTYTPKDFEEKIYADWENSNDFKPDMSSDKDAFSIVIPPPNVTGILHIGHALDNTLQDILIRYKRMAGFNALWVPGTDHASIATEAKIVAKLKEEYKGINILGYRNGYLKTDEEKQALIEDIVRVKPDVVFVAMGSPKQELLMEDIQKHHDAIFQGLGGSFDVYTGRVERAPKWWVKHNLEFAYRLIKEPKRIKRQIYLVKFAYWLMMNKI